MLCQKLIHALLKFLGPLLNGQHELPRATKMFYRGTLRVLVVLLHDFPEFLCSNYIMFAQAIPHSCVQLRNLILSAFPRVMHLPDPFTPDLKLELLPESAEEPVFDQSYALVLNGFKEKIDAFIEDKNTDVFLPVLDTQMGLVAQDYDVDKLCAFILYIGAKCAQTAKSDVGSTPAMMAYTHLLSKLDSEGKKIKTRQRWNLRPEILILFL